MPIELLDDFGLSLAVAAAGVTAGAAAAAIARGDGAPQGAALMALPLGSIAALALAATLGPAETPAAALVWALAPVFTALCLAAALADAATGFLADRTTLALAIFGLAMGAGAGDLGLRLGVAGLGGAGLYLLGRLFDLSGRPTGRPARALGAGDSPLFAALLLWLPPGDAPLLPAAAALLTLPIAIWARLAPRQTSQDRRRLAADAIPFGPGLTLAAWLLWLAASA